MSELTIHLLGQFQVLRNGKPVNNFASDKIRALLAYLIVEEHHPHRREKLATLFWPEKPSAIARTNLRRALSNLRETLDDYFSTPSHLIISRQDIQFNPKSKAFIDYRELNQMDFPMSNISTGNEKYHKILSLYQGKFLEGFSIDANPNFDDWLTMKQEQSEYKFTNLMHQLIQYYIDQENFIKALPLAWRLVETVPAQEKARRQLMRLLQITGNRLEALEQYNQVEMILKNDLDIEPEEATITIMELIKAGQSTMKENNEITVPHDSHQTQLNDEILEGWIQTLNLKDPPSYIHTLNVAKLTTSFAKYLGLPNHEIGSIRRGALLHDIGKAGIPDSILHKKGSLTSEEWAVMQTHPEKAYQVLSQFEYFSDVLDIPYCHHEKWDGTGYPRKSQGEEIPYTARLFSIVDTYEALTNDRPFRKSFSKNDAIAIIQNLSGQNFDPDLVKAFRKFIQE